ncbi:Family of unknown function (DUF662 [Striga hermonthica]|uniref:RAB6-interacting golgin n=1 Tax=Striga hermonthica TaxID=68872 RepID=A0A9N7RCM1_STRHE|nr:Family of unknown function (DUF662 [Striga hermonthica]
MTTPKQEQELEPPKQDRHVQPPKISEMINQGSLGSPLMVNVERDEEMTRSALAAFRAKEEEIERRKIKVKEKVHAQLGRVEEETKRLAEIREELEALHDPMRKDVAMIRKRVDLINRDLKLLGVNCQKKEKEYRDALEAFNEKNREKGELIGKLVQVRTQISCQIKKNSNTVY